MIIDSNSGINAPGGGAKRTGSSPVKDGSSAPGISNAAPETKPDVSLSSQATTLSRLEAQINASPDVNISRVAELKQAIADGTFEINAERIAEKMLNQDGLF